MAGKRKMSDKALGQILGALREEYLRRHPNAKIDGYRRGRWIVRLRVIDPDFRGVSMTDRDKEIWEILSPLPDDVVGDIHLLVLLTPDEAKTSPMNYDFEHPLPVNL